MRVSRASFYYNPSSRDLFISREFVIFQFQAPYQRKCLRARGKVWMRLQISCTSIKWLHQNTTNRMQKDIRMLEIDWGAYEIQRPTSPPSSQPTYEILAFEFLDPRVIAIGTPCIALNRQQLGKIVDRNNDSFMGRSLQPGQKANQCAYL